MVLRCDPEEIVRRVSNPDRAGLLKIVDPHRAREILAAGMTLPTWPELVDLDVTGLTAAEAAARVVALADGADDGGPTR